MFHSPTAAVYRRPTAEPAAQLASDGDYFQVNRRHAASADLIYTLTAFPQRSKS